MARVSIRVALSAAGAARRGRGESRAALATSLTGNPPSANPGVPYSTFGLPDWVTSLLNGATWSHNSWNQTSWNHNSWNAADWNHNSWNGDSWDHNSWNHNSWNDEGWH